MKLLVLGTRSFAPEIADVASDIDGVEVCGFVENMDRTRCSEKLEGLPIYCVDDMVDMKDSHVAVCGLGTTMRSRFIEQVESIGMRFATIIHPGARVSKNSTVSEGAVVGPGVLVATRTTIGRHVILNRGAMIGHHTSIGDYCSVMPGANVAGACTVGSSTYIGMGALILDHRTIGSHSVIGAGSIVTRDVPDNVQVIGAPAKIVKEHVEGR